MYVSVCLGIVNAMPNFSKFNHIIPAFKNNVREISVYIH